MKIFTITRSDINNGSTRVRALQFLKFWEKDGNKVYVLQRNINKSIIFYFIFLLKIIIGSIWANIVFLQKPNLSKNLIKLIAFLNKKVFVDIDDAVWEETSKDNFTNNKISPHNILGQRLFFAIKYSSCVIVGSNYLKRVLSSDFNYMKIKVVPPSFNFHFLQIPKKNYFNSEITRVGWIGSKGNLKDLNSIKNALGYLIKIKKIQLVVISEMQPVDLDFEFEFIKWSLDTELEILSTLDIGIMPLFDDKRSKGRCGYKAIQYSALSIPVICSPYGSGEEVVINGKTGFWALSENDWIEKLLLLVENFDLRLTLGNNARDYAFENYNTEKNAKILLNAFLNYS